MFFETHDLKNEEIVLNLIKTSAANREKQWLPAYYFDICLLDNTKIEPAT